MSLFVVFGGRCGNKFFLPGGEIVGFFSGCLVGLRKNVMPLLGGE